MRNVLHLRTSIIAIVTILAMLLVPACGSLCAAMTHCSSSKVTADSDSCHHAGMSAQDSGAPSLSSQASCAQQSPQLAILTSSDSSMQLESVGAARALLSINSTQTIAPSDRLRDFFSLKDSPQQTIPLENLSVLRI